MLVCEPHGSDSPVGPRGRDLMTFVGIRDGGMKGLGQVLITEILECFIRIESEPGEHQGFLVGE